MSEPQQCHVLVVDDDPMIRAVVAETLEMEGYPIETAINGLQAIQRIERTHPEVVLLDMRMPVLDGWGVAEEIRRRGIQISVVVMTAAQNAETWANQIGAEAFVAKPFDIEDLLDRVATTCLRRSQHH